MTFLAGFSKRKAIKIATAGIPSSSLTAFPKLFMISGDTDIGGETTSQKLAVTLADGVTQVPYGALSFSVSGGAATIKMRAKFDLSSSLSNGDTIGYLYYDHTATDQSNKSGVLDANTLGYWPLEEDPSGSAPQMKDWTGSYNGTTSGMVSGDSVNAQVSKGLDITGINNFVDFGALSSAPKTISFNLKTTDSGNYQPIIGQDVHGWFFSGQDWVFEIDNNDIAQFYTDSAFNQPNTAWTHGQWNHVALLREPSTTAKLYINGSLAATGAFATTNTLNTQHLYLGHNFYDPTAIVDEITIASVVRSADWIAYDHTDQFSNSSTFTLGSEETESSASPAVAIDWTNPRRKAAHSVGFHDQTKIWLLGQDAFFGMAGNPTHDFPVPAGRAAPIALRTWTDPVKLNLAGLDQFFAAPGQSPGQHDWPVPASRTPVVTLKTHANPTPLNLLGQDTFYASAGQVPTHDWKLPRTGRTGSISLLTFTDQFKLELIGQDQLFGAPGEVPSFDWQVPKGRAPQPLSFTLLVNPSPPVVPDVNLGGAGPVIQGFFIPRIAMGYFPEGEP